MHVPYGYLKRHKDFEEVNVSLICEGLINHKLMFWPQVYLYKDDDPFAPMYLSQNMEANR